MEALCRYGDNLKISERLKLIFLLLFTAATPLAAAESDSLVVRADSLSHDSRSDSVTAKGDVEIVWSGSTLYSQMATLFRGENRVAATGGVKLVKGGDRLFGDSAYFDLESKNGVITNGGLFVEKSNLHLAGEKIEKQGEQDYRLTNGTITSCDGNNPGWKFRVDDMNVTLEDFAYGKNATFYLGDIPVFWLPYLVFPVKTERQSGFLIPKFGHSNKKGVFAEIPYYQALSPGQDLTATLDLQSARGAGVRLDHRYLAINKGFGDSSGFLIYDTDRQMLRGDIVTRQQFNVTDSTYVRADATLALDRDYYRDYGLDSGDYNRQHLGALAFASHQTADLLITTGAEYTSNIIRQENDANLRRLPFVSINGSGNRLFATPLVYSFSAAATNFDSNINDHGQRVQISPRLMLPLSGSQYFYGNVWGGYNQRFYSGDAVRNNGVENSAGQFDAGARFGSDFARVYASPFSGFSRFRHLISPELTYTASGKSSQQTVPFFDYDDRPVHGSLLDLSFVNIITGRVNKELPEYRDLLRLNISQGYQLSGERRELETLVDYGRRFTDTKLDIELFPLQDWRLFSVTRVSPYNGNVTNATIGAEAGEPKGTRATVDYNHAEGRLDYLQGGLTYADFKPYTFVASGRYSFDKGGFLETLYSIEYKHQCWSVILAYRDRVDDKTFSFTFNLSGLGNIKLL